MTTLSDWVPAAVGHQSNWYRLVLFCCLGVAALLMATGGRSFFRPEPEDVPPTSGAESSAAPTESAVYVWPLRLGRRNDAGRLQRHYRQRHDLLWDPHPVFHLSFQANDGADGMHWGTIRLEAAEEFVPQSAEVHYIHEASNSSWQKADWHSLKNCFYHGQLDDDPTSKVVVSLCHGITGHLRTSKGSYFIEPLGGGGGGDDDDDDDDVDGAPLRHVLYNVPAQQLAAHETLLSSSTSNLQRSDAPPPPPPQGEKGRRRRSVSHERFVEVLVVADGKMVAYHGDNLVHYILTLMSVVSLIYKDASLANPVQMAVVRMLLLKDQEFSVLSNEHESSDGSSSGSSNTTTSSSSGSSSSSGKSASEMLRNFCKWQRVFNDADDASPLHHDTALLLTRENICRNPKLHKCDTLGLAELGTMCDPTSSCSIVQDNGLSAAFTIAHELGHVLNMPHDDDFKCQQFVESSGVHNVMSRMLDHNTFPWAWSNCSRHFITEYLDAGYGACLLDRPSKDLLDVHRAAKRLPGENFDETKQCEFVFGNGSKICPYMPTCKRLWCTTSSGEQEGCRTQHMPWADGTACGRGRWCRFGACVSRDTKSLEPVDGQWGPWQEWMMGTCSRTCGGGVQRSIRNCDSPPPANGGTFCLGKRVRYRSCNIQPCPAGSPDFREQQCSGFNNNNFNIQGIPNDVKWVPKYAGIHIKDRCRLYCRVEQSSAYYLLKDKVADGTPCGPDTDDICVNGICKQASCNHVLGRKEQLDLCGVCNGDNSTCVVLNGSFNQTQYGYNHVTRIPAGSSSLDIRQTGYQGSNHDDNYLALMDPQTGEYLLNGNFVVSMFQKTIQFGGTTIEYSGSDAVMERLNSSKPLKKDVVIQVLSVGNLYSPDIWYQYVVSRDSGPTYNWKLQDHWSTCNRLCQGQQFRKPVCVQVLSQQKMPEEYCSGSAPPQVQTQPCQTQCILRWRVTNRGECSVQCGLGVRNVSRQCEQESLQQQSISGGAMQGAVPLDGRHCRHLSDAPAETEPCQGKCQSAHWQYDPWTQCSRSCGGGIRQRKAECVDPHGQPMVEVHCHQEEKIIRENCRPESCPKWQVGDWTPCSVTCGTGEVERIVGCRMDNGTVVDGSFCSGQDRPRSIQVCVTSPCPTHPPTTHPPTTLPPTTLPARTTALPATTVTHPRTTALTTATHPPGTTRNDPLTSTTTPDPLVDLAGFRPHPLEIALNSSADLTSNEILPESGLIRHVKKKIIGTWRTGIWGQCSVSCDGGMRIRSVSCYDLLSGTEANETHCNQPKPKWAESCNTSACTQWISDQWTPCPETCGKGTSLRVVDCQFTGNGSRAPEELCNPAEKPSGEQKCSLPACGEWPISHSATIEHNHTSRNQWRTGSWGICSKTCGGGFRRRQVVCHDENAKASSGCIPAKRPQDTVHCNSDPCPTWASGNWTQCSKSCGEGTATRAVKCHDHLGQPVPDHRCHPSGRPEYSQTCQTTTCPTPRTIPPDKTTNYRWKTAPWTTCTRSCGKGNKFREVYCVDAGAAASGALSGGVSGGVNGTVSGTGPRVDERYCAAKQKRKPRSKRGCNRGHCPYVWQTQEWSHCSHDCGAGIQHRRVTCHRVNGYAWIDPEPVAVGCNATQRPADLQPCRMSECDARFSWKPSPWQPCVAKSCGKKGSQKRSLACVSPSGVRVSRSFCPQEFKPVHKKRCQADPCGYRSCLELRERAGKTEDGSYALLVGGRNISIYCHNMNSSMPKEYLNLITGHIDNYAEVYDKTLLKADTCPYHGARKDAECECFVNPKPHGLTTFSKIRLNVTSLRVDGQDFSFARSIRGHHMVGYGEAGDCYSTANCPQGRFSINLQGTALRVSPHTSWAGHGNRPSLWINRLEDNQKIQGKCGGFCGRCSPDQHAGLKLDVVPAPSKAPSKGSSSNKKKTHA